MLPILLSVSAISFAGTIVPGPILAVTLAKSYKSPWAGFQIALGHATIEIPLILLIYFGFSQFFQNNLVQLVLSTLGGGLIIWLGINMFRARADVVQGVKDAHYNAFTLGILTSALNPMFLLWWVTIGTMFIMKFHAFGIAGLILFIITYELPDLSWYSFVSVMTHKTKSLWGQRFQGWLFTACSLLLVGFGIWFLVTGIQILL